MKTEEALKTIAEVVIWLEERAHPMPPEMIKKLKEIK